MEINKNQPLTMCKCNAGGRGVPAFSPCSTTANPSLTDDGAKLKNSKKPAWLRLDLKETISKSRSPLASNVSAK